LESFKVYFALFRKSLDINRPYNWFQLFLKFSKGMLIFFIKGVRILFSEAISGVDAFSNSRMKLSRVSNTFPPGSS